MQLLADDYAIKETTLEKREAIGLKKGKEEAIAEFVKKLLEMGVLTITQITEAASVDEAFVMKMKETMTDKE